MNPTVIPDDLIETLRGARRIVFVTGAGTSAESGIPTFRDAQTGLWARYRPEELATPEAFRKDPGLVWRWYRWRRDKVLAAAPNAGHYAIAQMQASKAFSEFLVVTQNVDGLHQAAGSHPVVELHGSILRTRCFAGGHRQDSWPDSPESVEHPPQCPQCQSLLRPDVVWFNESLPAEALELAFEAAQRCDLLFSVGTSSVVYPAAAIAEAACSAGVPLTEINPQETPLSGKATWVLRGNSAEILPAIAAMIE